MIDDTKVRAAVRLLLEGIGEDPEREGLRDTPDRVARMYHELMSGMDEDPARHLKRTFATTSGDLVLEKNIPLYSMCEHHMLPFFGVAHVAYLPGDRVVGLSKIARAVQGYARRLQLQEQLTAQIADAFVEALHPRGVMVIIEAEHMCMTMRGVNRPGTRTLTYALRGEFRENDAMADRVLRLIPHS